jgi:RNA polymerase sigma-70 factor (ECF subfamily)
VADHSFSDFIRRIRAGDEAAAAELVRKYDAAIRLEVRMRLRDRRLQRLFDSMDVCQSVLGTFFARAAAGQFDLEKPEQLLRLLVAIARNKVAFQARKQQAQRRDHRRVEGGNAYEWDVAADDPSPSRQVEEQDLLHEFRHRLTEEERRLAERRGRGEGWAEIAASLGGTPEARRMQWARAVERVSRQLGLQEV